MTVSASLSPAVSHSRADVFITEELARRASHGIDHLREKQALQDLAVRMAEQPEAILPRLVQLAMGMTDATAAGLSLYEDDPAPGVFRWHHPCGSLSAFEGKTTPRHDSPCGVTLDRNAPVLACHAERRYAWIADAGIEVPEVLLVPLYVGGSDPLGTLWIVSDVEGHFDRNHARVASELAAFAGIALRMTRTEDRLRKSLEVQETLTREMSHRVKNVFALTDSMIRFGARGPGSKAEMAQALSGRLQSMATAHALVLPGVGNDTVVRTTSDLATLVTAVVRPYEQCVGEDDRFSVDGPVVPCGEQGVSGIALVVHELATNATKYGALKLAMGRVDVAWRLEGPDLVLTWKERGGPRADASPSHQGFGSRLVHNTVVRQFHGDVAYDWQRDGLVVTIRLPADVLSR